MDWKQALRDKSLTQKYIRFFFYLGRVKIFDLFLLNRDSIRARQNPQKQAVQLLKLILGFNNLFLVQLSKVNSSAHQKRLQEVMEKNVSSLTFQNKPVGSLHPLQTESTQAFSEEPPSNLPTVTLVPARSNWIDWYSLYRAIF